MSSKRPVPKLASIDELLLLSSQPEESSEKANGVQTIRLHE